MKTIKTVKEKSYYLSYQEKNGPELQGKVIYSKNLKTAKAYANRLFAECMINDCTKIKVSIF